MRRIILLMFFSWWGIMMTQAQESFSYQAIMRNSDGEIVASRTVSFRFSILMGGISGTLVYAETQSAKTDEHGMVTLNIGEGTYKTGNFATIPWDSDNFFLKTELDITGDTAFIDVGTTQLLVIPLALPEIELRKPSFIIEEDELFIARKYVGKFIDYRHTGFETFGGPNIIWIKTSMENTYGKISAYGKVCEFSDGENLYLKRTYYTPSGISGYWMYQIENDSSVFYRVTDFQHDKKVLAETWFK